MVKLSNVFFVILASYDQPVYSTMIKLRRHQLERRGIEHVFVIDGPRPEKLEYDEIYYDRTHDESTVGPKLEKRLSGLLVKFQKACVDFLNSRSKHFTHMLRINVSTFINFAVFENLLEQAPESNCYAGTWLFEEPWKFLSGTAILFSRDVVEHIASLNLSDYGVSREELDDVALGKILEPYVKPIDLFPMILMPDEWEELDKHPFIRVRNEEHDRDVDDKKHWYDLMRRYEQFDQPEGFSDGTEMGGWTSFIIFALVLLVVVWISSMANKKMSL